MNKKNRKNIIVILVVLVLLVAVFLFLKKNEDAEFMQEETESEEEQMVLTSVDEADVTEIEFTCGEDSFTLQRIGEAAEAANDAATDDAEVVDDTAEAVAEDTEAADTENGAEDADTAEEDVDIDIDIDIETTDADTADEEADDTEEEEDPVEWCFAGDTDTKVNGSSVSSFLSNICALTAKQEIPDVEDTEDYGITDDSDTITLQLADDLYVFRLGDYNSLASGYYITMNDNGSVYLIDSTTYYLLNKDRSYFEDT